MHKISCLILCALALFLGHSAMAETMFAGGFDFEKTTLADVKEMAKNWTPKAAAIIRGNVLSVDGAKIQGDVYSVAAEFDGDSDAALLTKLTLTTKKAKNKGGSDAQLKYGVLKEFVATKNEGKTQLRLGSVEATVNAEGGRDSITFSPQATPLGGHIKFYFIGAISIYLALLFAFSVADSARERKIKPCDSSHVPGEIERIVAGLRVWAGNRVQVFCVMGDTRVVNSFWRNIESRGYGSRGRLTCTIAIASSVYLESVKANARTSSEAFSDAGDFITLKFPRESRFLGVFARPPHIACFALAMPDAQKQAFDFACNSSLNWMVEQGLFKGATTSLLGSGRVLCATRSLTSIAQWLETSCNLFNQHAAETYTANSSAASSGNADHLEDQTDFSQGIINPANGAPMVPGSNMDIYGNAFGVPGINPTTGLPMVVAGMDVGGHAFGEIPIEQDSFAMGNNDFGNTFDQGST